MSPYWEDYPILKKPSDFLNQSARELLTEFQLQLENLPKLYKELLKESPLKPAKILVGAESPLKRRIDINISNWKDKCRQLAAGAILHYELTQREGYRIPVDKFLKYVRGKEKSLGGIMFFEDAYAILERLLPQAKYKEIADAYARRIRIAKKVFSDENPSSHKSGIDLDSVPYIPGVAMGPYGGHGPRVDMERALDR